MAGHIRSSQGPGDATEPMQMYDGPLTPGAPSPRPGLVLLYAERYEQLSPAYVLAGSDLTIGRDATADICVHGGAVSRQHARVSRKGSRWVITDLGGRNGTVV